VDDFRRQGYIPEALVNFLARLGWAYDDQKEVFTREELLELFDLTTVTPSPAVFDFQKLSWLNGVHPRALPESTRSVVEYPRRGRWDEEPGAVQRRSSRRRSRSPPVLTTRCFFEEVIRRFRSTARNRRRAGRAARRRRAVRGGGDRAGARSRPSAWS
jgi:glutamyl/glutaminyl-tRNA synthetase